MVDFSIPTRENPVSHPAADAPLCRDVSVYLTNRVVMCLVYMEVTGINSNYTRYSIIVI